MTAARGKFTESLRDQALEQMGTTNFVYLQIIANWRGTVPSYFLVDNCYFRGKDL